MNLIKKPSSKEINQILIGLEMHSMESFSEIHIKHILMYCPSWRMECVEDSEKILKPNGSCLQFIRAHPMDSKDLKETSPEFQVTAAVERLILLQEPDENESKKHISLFKSLLFLVIFNINFKNVKEIIIFKCPDIFSRLFKTYSITLEKKSIISSLSRIKTVSIV